MRARETDPPPARPSGSKPGKSGRRRIALTLAALAFALGLLIFDLRRPSLAQWSARALISGIGLYRATLSPTLERLGIHCRFHPSCSRYAATAIHQDGALRGGARSLERLARCGPWTPEGTVDPP